MRGIGFKNKRDVKEKKMYREDKMYDMPLNGADFSELVYAVGVRSASEILKGEVFTTENRDFSGRNKTDMLKSA
jgi:hypothetical protein